MDLVGADDVGTDLLAIAGDPVADLAEPRQGLVIDAYHDI
jgi:hypothetical protein